MLHRFAAAVLALSAVAAPASAHDVWLTLSSGERVPRLHVHYGHPDDLQHPQIDKVVELTATNADGTRVIATTLSVAASAPILASEPVPGAAASLVSVRYDNGFWVKAKDGAYRNTTRRFVPDAAEALTSVKFAKLVAGPGAPWSAVVGHDLEIVPLADPLAVKPGETLPVRVLFRGLPVAGADVLLSDGESVVAQDSLPRARTGADGVATVVLGKAGGEVLSVSRRVAPSSVPALADVDTYSATLAFTTTAPRTN